MFGNTSKTVGKKLCHRAGPRTWNRPANFVACAEAPGMMLLQNCDPPDVGVSDRMFRGTTADFGWCAI